MNSTSPAAALDAAIAKQARAEAESADAFVTSAIALHREAVKEYGIADGSASFALIYQALQQAERDVLVMAAQESAKGLGLQLRSDVPVTVSAKARPVVLQAAVSVVLGQLAQARRIADQR